MSAEYYRLGRDTQASIRLFSQHFLWKDQLGFNLHPRATEGWRNPEDETIRMVADVCCGNGIWLIEEARLHPPATTRFCGFDISPSQFPPSGSVPANVSFHTLDVYAPIPDSLQNAFDVVHVRMLIGLVRNGDPRPVLMHLMQMLKPGGVLQWDELDIASLFMYPPGSSPDACNSFETRLVSMYPGANAHYSNDLISQLSSIFAECGLADVQAIKMGKPREGM